LNLAKYDEWKDTETPYNAIVFLDAVAEEFIQRAKNMPGMEKAVAFTKKARALGLGVMGFHSLLQQRRLVWGTFEAMQLNTEIFSKIAIQSEQASRDMAEIWGEPEWLKGTGLHNSHRIAIAPTKSTGLIMGGVSEGINPDTAYVYTQKTAGGDVQRINPELLKLARERDMDKKPVWDRIRAAMGSVQDEDWLSEHEKEVFKTAFEINQHSVITMASQRARWIDQWQSLNLFFSADEDEEVISAVHKQAFLDPNILGLYYIYSQSGVQAANDKDECLACQ
jgi:ribonucleoside-diphosphate reductase alpha chain